MNISTYRIIYYYNIPTSCIILYNNNVIKYVLYERGLLAPDRLTIKMTRNRSITNLTFAADVNKIRVILCDIIILQ